MVNVRNFIGVNIQNKLSVKYNVSVKYEQNAEENVILSSKNVILNKDK